MSKSRLPSARGKARRATKPVDEAHKDSRCHRFLGVSLSGGKADKSCVVLIDYYPEHKKIFLARSFDRIKSDGPESSADQKIIEILQPFIDAGVESLSFDAPLSLPKCVRCDLVCPGFEVCDEPEIKWLREQYVEINKSKRPKRHFTPYTQRCAETFVALASANEVELQHCLGANHAPLTARALFLSRRLSCTIFEASPKLTIWRLGTDLRMNKSQLRELRQISEGEDHRHTFLQHLVAKSGIFIYQQDLKMMVENIHAFDAFLCALTGFMKFRNLVEPRPKDYPSKEAWIQVPRTNALREF